MQRLLWRKALKIGKTERYALSVSKWLGADPLVYFDAEPPPSSTLLVSDITSEGGVISCLISGATETGDFEIHFAFASTDRNDCQNVRLSVIDDC